MDKLPADVHAHITKSTPEAIIAFLFDPLHAANSLSLLDKLFSAFPMTTSCIQPWGHFVKLPEEFVNMLLGRCEKYTLLDRWRIWINTYFESLHSYVNDVHNTSTHCRHPATMIYGMRHDMLHALFAIPPTVAGEIELQAIIKASGGDLVSNVTSFAIPLLRTFSSERLIIDRAWETGFRRYRTYKLPVRHWPLEQMILWPPSQILSSCISL